MTDGIPPEEATLFPRTPGERLREARESQGLSLDEIAARTRVPVRQLEAIEQGNYTTLPSITYSVGFARAYARAVGIDEVQIANEVRAQNTQASVRRTEYESYSAEEVTRVPPNRVVIIGVIVALALVILSGLWYGTTWFRGDEAPAPAATETAAQDSVPVAPPTTAVPAAGQVTLTANDEVWIRVYDATGTKLFQNIMKPGDKFDVPANANGPMINVGRPDKLTVTVNGTVVPPLGSGKVAIKDVKIDAASLAARAAPAPAATASPTPLSTATPAARPTPRAEPTRRAETPPPSNAAQPLNIAAPAPPASQPAPAATPLP
ncbi:helix-turn-helix domain-containing protein [Sphingomonas immobilis]|uniref:Helix-turn-helix domain-containing protein n=1 Tax=Sphingomonas immobilis TaxID=3063997 RepID=A0ABT9A636_9SPHN|nr:helix-turn-helix domain-containing protein [Sphingomonas sp. CA1-15]MDO7844700.1 helix-turn-helix domain-containing protein [Sphingomonas sp. CA1-15]